MIVRWTGGALVDLTSIENYQRHHWPELRAAFERRLTAIEHRIAEFPLSAPEVYAATRRTRVAFIDFAYRLFYSVESDAINVLAVRHTSRRLQFE